MTYTDFVKTVESTSWHQPNERLLHAAMGLCTETAELFEIDNEQHQLEELGDICWYLALGLDAIGHSFEAVPLLETEDFLNKVRGEDPGQALVIYSSDLLDMVKKQVFYGREIDATKAVDAFVMIKNVLIHGMVAIDLDYDIDAVVAANIKKLTARFPEKFSEDAANNRDVKAEYAAMNR